MTSEGDGLGMRVMSESIHGRKERERGEGKWRSNIKAALCIKNGTAHA